MLLFQEPRKMWFGAFREYGSPSSYGGIQDPLPVSIKTLMLFCLFLVPYIAFLIIFPGLREKRLSTFVTMTHHLGVGALLMAAIVLPYWNVGSNVIVSQLKAYSAVRHEAELTISVGLKALNVSLRHQRALISDGTDNTLYNGMYINEQYTMDGVNAMGVEMKAAFDGGMPYPVLKVLEFFTLNHGVFSWGREYRNAGYYTCAVLWVAFVLWCLQLVLMAMVPHQFGKAGLLTGAFTLTAVLVYIYLSPDRLEIPFVGRGNIQVSIVMRYGASFYLAIVSGLLSVLYSCLLCLLQHFDYYTLDTVLNSVLDDTVAPHCTRTFKKHANAIHVIQSTPADCVNPEVLEEARIETQTPPVEPTPYHESQQFNIPTSSTLPRLRKSPSDHSGSSNRTKLTTADSESRSLDGTNPFYESHGRHDSIGSIDPRELTEDRPHDPSNPFTRPSFTLDH